MHSICEKAGLPVEPHKSEGLATSLVFLGIEIDSVAGILRLPEEKLHTIKTTLALWCERKACRKRELLSLIGILAHASKVVQVSRIFLHRLIDLSTQGSHLDHFIWFKMQMQNLTWSGGSNSLIRGMVSPFWNQQPWSPHTLR